LALFLFIVQARDLLLDLPGSAPSSTTASGFYSPLNAIWAAVRFGLLLLIFWALPVHAVARISVGRNEWLTSPYGSVCDPAHLKDARNAFRTPGTHLPRILGACCFAIMVVGLIYAGLELRHVKDDETTKWAFIALASYLVSTVVFGALFLLYAYRRRGWFEAAARVGRRPGRPLMVNAQPRIALGATNPGIVNVIDRVVVWSLFAVLVTILAMPSLLGFFPRLLLVLVLLGAWVPVLGALAAASHVLRFPVIVTAICSLTLLSCWFGDDHDVMTKKLFNETTPAQISISKAVEAWKKANGCFEDPQKCPSPILVASAGGASRAAFMTASTLGLLLDATCLDEQHRKLTGSAGSVPILPASCRDVPVFGRRLFAISSVSGGSLGAIVYARSYFDGVSRKRQDASTDGNRRVYAPPCRTDRPSDLWFRYAAPTSWRSCLQTILAEDFLSPVFAGLGFRDVFSFIGALRPINWPDRGKQIESAWIGAYEKYVDPAPSSPAGLGANFSYLTPVNSSESEWRPLLLLNSTSVEKGKRVIASHLSSTYLSKSDCDQPTDAAGTSCIRLFTDAYDVNEMLNETTRKDSSQCAEASPVSKNEVELTIAGAAHNSARFTIVSPAGNLLKDDRSQGHVVDGGYFDNYGALTAFDLADTLRWEFDLYPFVLLITNDPSDNSNAAGSLSPDLPWFSLPPEQTNASRTMFASVVAAPVGTVLASRSGHGSTALKLMRGLVDPEVYQRKSCKTSQKERKEADAKADDAIAAALDNTCYGLGSKKSDGSKKSEPCFAHVALLPEGEKSQAFKNVSMSWWLSKPVQKYLDDHSLGETT